MADPERASRKLNHAIRAEEGDLRRRLGHLNYPLLTQRTQRKKKVHRDFFGFFMSGTILCALYFPFVSFVFPVLYLFIHYFVKASDIIIVGIHGVKKVIR